MVSWTQPCEEDDVGKAVGPKDAFADAAQAESMTVPEACARFGSVMREESKSLRNPRALHGRVKCEFQSGISRVGRTLQRGVAQTARNNQEVVVGIPRSE